ncbi:caspase family protein [Flammeovirga pacifica]|uniref:Peptidase C14 caspase domain-containing protein n=1 Tax=Flammeovirga pacifica TaxID=915059 RepID=A0A1S1YXC6_FLAPC|nr:caspase family protein [Flammeovirga pacifica]OHX65648.1 hypothetical protein NH26_04435 [Flammeovirga pacifica]
MVYISLFFCLPAAFCQNNIALTFSQGHLGAVTALDISTDGNIVISSGDDRKIKLWDVGQKRLIKTINAHEIGITDISLSSDNQYIVSSGLDHKVRVWSTKTGELLDQIENLQESVQEVRFENKKVIYINSIGNIYHWDWQTDDDNKTYHWNENFSDGISRFLTIERSSNVFIGNFKGEVQVWNPHSKRLKAKRKLHNDWVSGLVYIKNQNLLVSGSWDGSLVGWDTKNDSIYQLDIIPDGSGVKDISYSQQNNMLIVTTTGNHAYFYTIENKHLSRNTHLEKEGVGDTAFSTTGEIGVVSYLNGDIEMWDVKNLKVLSSWKPVTSKATDFTISKNSGDIAVSSHEGDIKLWEFGSRKDLKKWEAHDDQITYLRYLTNGFLMSCGLDSTINFWNPSNYYQKHDSYKHTSSITHAFSLSHHLIVFSDENGDVFTFDFDTQLPSKVYSSYYPITSVTTNNSGSKIVFALSNRKIGIIDLTTNDTQLINADDWYIKSIKFNQKEDKIIIGGKHKLTLIDAETYEVIHSVDIEEPVQSTVFTYDDQYILVGGQNGVLRSYTNDLSSVVFDYSQNANDILQLADFKGKQVFLTLSNDFSINIWDLESNNKYGGVYINGETGWMVEHFSGLFDASESNINDLYYVANQEIIELNQLQNMYWEPGLATKLFTGEPLRQVPIINEIALFPEAETQKRNNKLIIDVTDRGGGIGKVGVLVNGKEVLDDISNYKTNFIQSAFVNGRRKERYIVPLDSINYLFTSEHLNDITVIVENTEGSLNGRGLTIKHRDNKNTAEPNFYGIVIGVSDYRGSSLDLKYAAKDATSISEAVKTSAEELFGTNRVKITTLTTDETEPQNQPSKENIQAAFDSLSKMMTPSDVLFIFMAGHGMSKKFNTGEEDFYFLTKDMITADIEEEEIRNNYCISGKEWLDWMKKMPVTRQVFIMDACNAGQFAETILAVRNVDEESVRLRALERVRSRSGMYLLAGASADKVSYESTLYGQGLLTYSILDYFKTGNLRKGEFVDVQLLFGNAVDEVPRLAERFGAFQQPEMRIPNGGDSFDIGRVTDQLKNNIDLNNNIPRIRATQFEEESTWIDELEFADKIDKQLLIRSESKNNRYNPFIFSPYIKGENVFQIKGKYHKTDDGINMQIKILEGDQIKHSFEILENDPKLLVDKVIFGVISYFNNL